MQKQSANICLEERSLCNKKLKGSLNIPSSSFLEHLPRVQSSASCFHIHYLSKAHHSPELGAIRAILF